MGAPLNRRRFLKLAGGALLAPPGLPAGGASVEAETPQELSRPNILVVLTDDQTEASTARAHMPKTRAALADRGTVFAGAQVAVPLCGPSRAALLTGRYPGNRNAVHQNEHASRKFRDRGLHRDCLPYFLNREAGYRVGLFGKWLNGYAETPAFVPPGFAGWFATWGHTGYVNANAWGRVARTGVRVRDETEELADRALRFVGNSERDFPNRPWFCLLSFSSPHQPANPSAANAGSYASAPLPKPPSWDHRDPNKPAGIGDAPAITAEEEANTTRQWRGRMEEVRDVDDHLARVLAALDLANTHVFFLSDNGYMHGEHRVRGKAVPYAESVDTHLWAAGPGVREGATVDDLTLSIDVTATCYELAGLDGRAAETDGRSLLPAMVGADEAGGSPQAGVPAETGGRRASMLVVCPPGASDKAGETAPGWRSVRTPGRLYVEHGTGEAELYDMDPASPGYDPWQLSSLQNDPARAAEVADLSRRLAALSGASGEALREAEGTA